jgi:hypothetical protein
MAVSGRISGARSILGESLSAVGAIRRARRFRRTI